ncbi:MAG: LacI family DNA-binding transcriptional regulator [Xanthobacteraceae bacterium]|jgi:LacI family transcriptional regulator
MAEATIRDVAKRAQLSVATVSRALNGFENVSEAAREKIAAAVKELGYVPHAGARSLSLAKTNAIGVVLPALHGEFFSEIVRGMDQVASARGYFLLLSNMHPEAPDGGTAVLRPLRGRVDGLLLMAPHVADRELVEALPSGLPTLLINTRSQPAGWPGIHLDNAAGAKAVAEHLLALGRKRIVHIAGPAGNIDAQERADAFRKAAGNALIATVPGDFYEEGGEKAVKGLLASGEKFDAIFAANDNMAIGALTALREAGVKVPEDVAVAGFDDIPLAKHLGLTTVRVRIAELGERALERLIAILGGRDPGGDEMHAPELVVRSSTSAD